MIATKFLAIASALVLLLVMAVTPVASVAAKSASTAGTTAQSATSSLKLERVVMLMRHSVRPPTKEQPTPKGTTAEPWSKWTTPVGELTPHGAQGARLMGVYDRGYLSGRGLLSAEGCAPSKAISVWASGKSRAIKTAQSFVEGLQPGCNIEVAHPLKEDEDPVFHPLDSGAKIDGAAALAAAQRQAPKAGLVAETAIHRDEFNTLQRVMGCCSPPVCAEASAKPSCSIADLPTKLTASEGDAPSLDGLLGIASTAAQTIMLEYVEGKPMSEVGWGRASKADISAMLRFHTLKFHYEVRAPYVAERMAAPIAQRILDALQLADASALTLLVGHDTNVAAFGGFLDLHWQAADFPRDDPPPGGALGFELLRNAAGKQYVRAFYQSQSMDQLRKLTPLDAANPPSLTYIKIPGCAVKGDATLCDFETFQAIVNRKLQHPAKS